MSEYLTKNARIQPLTRNPDSRRDQGSDSCTSGCQISASKENKISWARKQQNTALRKAMGAKPVPLKRVIKSDNQTFRVFGRQHNGICPPDFWYTLYYPMSMNLARLRVYTLPLSPAFEMFVSTTQNSDFVEFLKCLCFLRFCKLIRNSPDSLGAVLTTLEAI